MQGEAQQDRAQAAPNARHDAPRLEDYPVREYIGAMTLELAQMARWDGDEQLACVLEAAAVLAQSPLEREPTPEQAS
jgi:hypothetical protein